jgi:hypothetical protein
VAIYDYTPKYFDINRIFVAFDWSPLHNKQACFL